MYILILRCLSHSSLPFSKLVGHHGKGRYARLKWDIFLKRLSNNKGTSFLDLRIFKNRRDSTVLHILSYLNLVHVVLIPETRTILSNLKISED